MFEEFMGKLIVIEGIDGSGKNTQAKLLLSRLEQEGYKVGALSFPDYESFFGKEVARYLNGEFGDVKDVHPKLISMLYAGDRYLSKPKILETLKSCNYLILDRYVSSNVGHQASKIDDLDERNAMIQWILELEYGQYALPKPDATIFLDVPPSFSDELVLKKAARSYTDKKKDLHEGDKQHLLQAYNTYTSLARSQADWHLLDCTQDNKLLSIEEISEKLLRLCLTI